MAAGKSTGGMRAKERGQAYGFLTQLFAQQTFTRGCLVAFVEQQIQGREHTVHAVRQARRFRDFETDAGFANSLLGSRQLFLDRCVATEDGPRDFTGAESTENFQREYDLRV